MQRGSAVEMEQTQGLFECCFVNDTENGTGEEKEHLHNSQLCVWPLYSPRSEVLKVPLKAVTGNSA